MARVDAVPVALRRLHQHAVGADLADHAGDVAAQIERRLDAAVGVAEEVQVVHADHRGGRGLLLAALRRHLDAGHAGLGAARVAVGHDAVA